MDLNELLERRQEEILAEATEALSQARLRSYEKAGAELRSQRLRTLFQRTRESLRDRSLLPLTQYAEQIAQERYAAGFDVYEVQAAFNVLEEVLWRHIIQETPPAELAEAIGKTSTVLGAGKGALARAYVALAGKHHAPALDLDALFKGTAGS
jgi:hypothetical protein